MAAAQAEPQMNPVPAGGEALLAPRGARLGKWSGRGVRARHRGAAHRHLLTWRLSRLGLGPPLLGGALLPGHLRALLPSLRKADRDRLLAALHLAAMTRLPPLERAALATAHCAPDALARALAVLPAARLPRGCLLGRHRTSAENRVDLETDASSIAPFPRR